MHDVTKVDEDELEKYGKQREYLVEQKEKGRDGKLTTQLMGALKNYAGGDGMAHVFYSWDEEQEEFVKTEMTWVWEGSLRPEIKEKHDLILSIGLSRPFANYDFVEDWARSEIDDELAKIPHPERVRERKEKLEKKREMHERGELEW